MNTTAWQEKQSHSHAVIPFLEYSQFIMNKFAKYQIKGVEEKESP